MQIFPSRNLSFPVNLSSSPRSSTLFKMKINKLNEVILSLKDLVIHLKFTDEWYCLPAIIDVNKLPCYFSSWCKCIKCVNKVLMVVSFPYLNLFVVTFEFLFPYSPVRERRVYIQIKFHFVFGHVILHRTIGLCNTHLPFWFSRRI